MTLTSVTAGSGAPLVLVHGLGGRRQSWDPVLPALTAARTVTTLDLPGHGASAPLSGPLGFERLCDVLQQHLESADLSAADLVGSSMGARTVLELARRGVGRHVVALDPGGVWNDAEKAVFGQRVAEARRHARRGVSRRGLGVADRAVAGWSAWVCGGRRRGWGWSR